MASAEWPAHPAVLDQGGQLVGAPISAVAGAGQVHSYHRAVLATT